MIAWKMLVGLWILVCFYALAGLLVDVLIVGLVITAVVTLVRWLIGKGETS